jgi:hypothetical protein
MIPLYPEPFDDGWSGQTADYADEPPCSIESFRLWRLVRELVEERCPFVVTSMQLRLWPDDDEQGFGDDSSAPRGIV